MVNCASNFPVRFGIFSMRKGVGIGEGGRHFVQQYHGWKLLGKFFRVFSERRCWSSLSIKLINLLLVRDFGIALPRLYFLSLCSLYVPLGMG